ncbi:Pkinase-domain-containing protein [Eremomyces bilateralis CBS 781.70]|uniref:Pkinase-domain-containing protein n=1 Tax=Eremomyces bilateralis CBS 781.70 TaxID=1392243 RepID=A0A6G1G1V8_9PEZI|nr:Pkinase-domain-containing protein [Eremomyces bilateralis CBS 781.70]KAF1811910.1 Pkinase-domain-containing protein [Eremomyces bilateralis CBS 781.70]
MDRPYQGVSKVTTFDFIAKLGEGTFGEVWKCRDTRSKEIVALKKIIIHSEKDGFPITALREIKLLNQVSHPNLLKLMEMAVKRGVKAREKDIHYMVTPYMEHDLSGLLDNPDVDFTEGQIKSYMLQLLAGLEYLHEARIMHRDMKAANLLISNKGILQIADFGLARPYFDSPPKPGQGGGSGTHDYTALVVTRWYRPPELLMKLTKYTTAVDMWGVGCVFGEMFKRKPILVGTSDENQATLIFNLVGSPSDQNMPGWKELPGVGEVYNKIWAPTSGNLRKIFRELSTDALDLLEKLLTLDWRGRINAIDALKHPYFRTKPYPLRPHEIPRFEDSHEIDRRSVRSKPNLPPAPAGGEMGNGQNDDFFNDRGAAYSRAPGVGAAYRHHSHHSGPDGRYHMNSGRNAPRAHDRERKPHADSYVPAYSDGARVRDREPGELNRRSASLDYDDTPNRKPRQGERQYRDRDYHHVDRREPPRDRGHYREDDRDGRRHDPDRPRHASPRRHVDRAFGGGRNRSRSKSAERQRELDDRGSTTSGWRR